MTVIELIEKLQMLVEGKDQEVVVTSKARSIMMSSVVEVYKGGIKHSDPLGLKEGGVILVFEAVIPVSERYRPLKDR